MDPSVRPSPALRVEARGRGVVTLTLNRGERFNPLSTAMIAALEAELDALATGRKRASGGAGRAAGVSAPGHDLKEMRAHSDDKACNRSCSRTATA